MSTIYHGQAILALGPSAATDRAYALVAASAVDVALTTALQRYIRDTTPLPDEEMTSLFATRGILGTFGAKIMQVYFLRFASENTRTRLQQVEAIRNEFAHNGSELSFETPEIVEHCDALRSPKNPGDSDARRAFQICCEGFSSHFYNGWGDHPVEMRRQFDAGGLAVL